MERSSADVSGDDSAAMAVDTSIDNGVLEDNAGYEMGDVQMTDGSNEAAETIPHGPATPPEDEPQSSSVRTRSQLATDSHDTALLERPSAGYSATDRVVTQASLEQLAQLSDEQLFERAAKVCTSNPERPMPSGEAAIVGPPTVKHAVRIRATIRDLFSRRADSICRSLERPDLSLSMEEAYGHLAADLMLGPTELLPEEPRRIGKQVDTLALREDKSHENARSKAKDARGNARKAARKCEAKAAALEQTIAEIDLGLERKRAERLAKPVDLFLPARNTVVHVPRPPTAAEVDRAAVTKWRRLEAAAKAAEAEAKAAKQEAALAAHEAERAEKSHARLGPCPTLGHLLGLDMPCVRVRGQLLSRLVTEMPEGEHEYRQLELERWAGSQKLAHELSSVAFETRVAATEAHERAEDAREEADAAALLCSSAHWAAEREAKAAEAAQAKAAEAAAHARIEQIEARIAELELIERERMRGWVKMEAARAWPEGERPNPKVFSLVGMSADNVRAVAGEVSQG